MISHKNTTLICSACGTSLSFDILDGKEGENKLVVRPCDCQWKTGARLRPASSPEEE